MATYTKEHEVAYYECDVNQTMTLPSLVSIAIKVSEEQSSLLQRDKTYIRNLGVTWVIVSYHITLQRLPYVGEKVTFSTEAKEYNKYFCYRYFWVHDKTGNELVKIEAVFALMGIEDRKLSRVSEEIIAPYESQKISKIKRYPRIGKIDHGKKQSYRVRFYDIDSNLHVNNAVYFNWVFDVLGFEFLTHYQPKELTIRFDKEVAYGQTVDSHYEILEEQSAVQSLHEIKIADTTNCEAMITWEKRS